MFVQLEVEVEIRKGLGPDTFTKHYPFAYDDLPEDTTTYEITEMAKSDLNSLLSKTDDYPVYGKNWNIIDYHFT